MNFLRWLAICGGLLCFGHAYGGPSALTTAQLYIDGHTCSGTVVAPSTILSAAHCFQEEENELGFKITTQAGTMLVDGYKVYIMAVVFDDADHALVKVDFVFKDRALIGKEPEVGAKVYYWGNAAKLNNTYREGYVASYLHGEMQIDVNGFFGDSGAGIFDESGKLVGVMSYISVHPHDGLIFRMMGTYPFEFTPLQYSMMGVTPP